MARRSMALPVLIKNVFISILDPTLYVKIFCEDFLYQHFELKYMV